MPINHLKLAPYGFYRGENFESLCVRVSGTPGEVVSDYYFPTITWEPNVQFQATMEFLPDVAFRVKDIATGRAYNVFPSDVVDYITWDIIRASRIDGIWQVVKRNTSYGIMLVV